MKYMELINTKRVNSCFFLMDKHWAFNLLIDFSNNQVYAYLEPRFTFQLDFLFFRFWFIVYKKKK